MASYSESESSRSSSPHLSTPRYPQSAPIVPSYFRTLETPCWSKAKAVLYEGISAEEWNEWWSRTPWYLAAKETGKHKKIVWSTNRKSSESWQHFQTCAQSINGKPYVICTRCKYTLQHPATNNTGTSALSKHLATNNCIIVSKKQGLSSIKAAFEKAKQFRAPYEENIQWTAHGFLEQTIRLVTSLNLSFRSLDHPEFHKWVAYIKKTPRHAELQILPSRHVRKHLGNVAQDGRRRILQTIPAGAKIAIALDCWTSPNHKSFLAITGYFIDAQWQYQEVLLGFENVEGSHTGQQLAAIVQETLKDCELPLDKLITMTTDNASNNKTLGQSLSNALTILNENNDHEGLARIPCLAHVIQLACNKLLKVVKVHAQNDTIITVWGEKEDERQQHTVAKEGDGAPWTLKKLRNMVIYINASTQRRNKFHTIQARRQPLNLLQDVATRWNSTFLMMLRARRLREDIESYNEKYPNEIPTFTATEWKHIDYLIEILLPFYRYTNAVGRIRRGPTIHNVYAIYNSLFDHLERYIELLQRKRKVWKKQMLEALNASKDKLQAYYAETSAEQLGDIYAVATILGPQHKMQIFEDESWEDYAEKYRKTFEEVYTRYQAQLSVATSLPSNPRCPSLSSSQTCSSNSDPIEISSSPSTPSPALRPTVSMKRKATDSLSTLLRDTNKKKKYTMAVSQSEIVRYLRDSESFEIDWENEQPGDTLLFWQRAESRRRYPVLAAMARDYLCIPAAGVGVERLFSSARDVCTYRRHRLRPDTIRDLMLASFADRFERCSETEEDQPEVDGQSEDEDRDGEIVHYDVDCDIENIQELISDAESEDEEMYDAGGLPIQPALVTSARPQGLAKATSSSRPRPLTKHVLGPKRRAR